MIHTINKKKVTWSHNWLEVFCCFGSDGIKCIDNMCKHINMDSNTANWFLSFQAWMCLMVKMCRTRLFVIFLIGVFSVHAQDSPDIIDGPFPVMEPIIDPSKLYENSEKKCIHRTFWNVNINVMITECPPSCPTNAICGFGGLGGCDGSCKSFFYSLINETLRCIIPFNPVTCVCNFGMVRDENTNQCIDRKTCMQCLFRFSSCTDIHNDLYNCRYRKYFEKVSKHSKMPVWMQN